MIPITVSTFHLTGAVLGIMTWSGTVCTQFLTFTVILCMTKFLTVKTPKRIRNVDSNRYSKEICNVYVFWYSCGVEGEDEGASVTTFTSFRSDRNIGACNNPLRF